MLPAELSRQVAELAETTLRAKTDSLEGVWDDHSLLAVEWMRDALVALQPVQRCSAASSLVRYHAADSAPHDLGRSTLVKWTMTGVGVRPLAFESGILQLGTIQRSRHVGVL